MKPTELILIRHGETPWTRQRRYQGRSNTSLSPHGLKQARCLGHYLSRYKADLLYVSSLTRALQTAALIQKRIKKKVHTDSRLNELFFGKWEGRSAAELIAAKDPVFRKWCEGRLVTPPGGESLKSLRARTSGFLKDCLRRHCGKTVAVVSHGGPIKTLLFEALKLPARSLWSLRIDPASVTVLNFYPHFTQLVSLNQTSHLSRERTDHRT